MLTVMALLFNAHHLYGHLVSAGSCVVEGGEAGTVHRERRAATQVAQEMGHTATRTHTQTQQHPTKKYIKRQFSRFCTVKPV